MNFAIQNAEPGWKTYLKSAAVVLPTLFVWLGCCVFVVPKLKELGSLSKTEFPQVIRFELAVADIIKLNFLLGTLLVLTVLIVMEWRWHGWARHRRLLFGLVGFFLNLSALFVLASLLVYAVMVASRLVQPQ